MGEFEERLLRAHKETHEEMEMKFPKDKTHEDWLTDLRKTIENGKVVFVVPEGYPQPGAKYALILVSIWWEKICEEEWLSEKELSILEGKSIKRPTT